MKHRVKQFAERIGSNIGKPIDVDKDVLIKELKNDINKDTLWRVFGEVIYNNLQNNLKGTEGIS